MIIHTVQPNETINLIAKKYGVPADQLVLHNHISNPNRLSVGQTLMVLFPKETYKVQEGDNLTHIAESHGISLMQLLRNNIHLFDREYIYPDEVLVISYTDDKLMEISTNGYAFPFINSNILRKTLPYLTYLTIFYYKITSDGGIIDINDQDVIDTAREYGVAPIMLISTLTDKRTIDMETTHNILTNLEVQENLIFNTLENMRTKGYYGLNIDMQNVLPEYRQQYVDFIWNISQRVKQEGYSIFVTISPDTFPSETGSDNYETEMEIIGQIIDAAMLVSYQWGNLNSPQPALPLDEARSRVDFYISILPPEIIFIGLPIIGYIWPFPLVPGEFVAHAITLTSALNLAFDVGATIHHDPASDAPYYTYTIDNDYVVWFRDIKSTLSLLNLIVEYGLEGIGIWNIMYLATGLWSLINALFHIRKV